MKKSKLKVASYGTLLQKKRATALKEEVAVSTPQENLDEEIKTDPMLPEKVKSVTYAKPVIQDDEDLDKEGDDMEEDDVREDDEYTDEDLEEIGDMEEYEDEDDDEDRDQDEDTDRNYARDFTE